MLSMIVHASSSTVQLALMSTSSVAFKRKNLILAIGFATTSNTKAVLKPRNNSKKEARLPAISSNTNAVLMVAIRVGDIETLQRLLRF